MDEWAIKEKYEVLRHMQKVRGSHNIEEIKNMQKEIGIMLDNVDLKWRQRAKTNRYRMGDCKTKFFQACAMWIRKMSRISQIIDDNTIFQTDKEDVRMPFSNTLTKYIYQLALERMILETV